MDRTTTGRVVELLKDSLLPVKQFIDDDATQEIMINGPNDVWVESSGRVQKFDIAISEVQIGNAIKILASLVGKEAVRDNSSNAILDARIDGFRIAAALSAVATKGPTICIRKHGRLIRSFDDYIKDGSMTEEVAQSIRDAVANHKNILVSGGTSSGKSTFLNAMIALISEEERVLTIEDTQELKVKTPNWVSFEANSQAGITIRDLVKLSLRYRPDRIIVGEVRGPEAFDLMQALNTGHDGGFATLHANSARAALSRLESLVLQAPDVDWPLEAIRTQVGSTFHFVVQLVRENGKRRVKEVIEIDSYDNERKQYVTKSIL